MCLGQKLPINSFLMLLVRGYSFKCAYIYSILKFSKLILYFQCLLFTVGGGTSGSVLASRLSEDPDSVLLIEAGRSDLENENVPIPGYAGNIQLTQDDWNYFTVRQRRTGYGMNGRVSIIY